MKFVVIKLHQLDLITSAFPPRLDAVAHAAFLIFVNLAVTQFNALNDVLSNTADTSKSDLSTANTSMNDALSQCKKLLGWKPSTKGSTW